MRPTVFAIVLLCASLPLAGPAGAQTAVKLQGTCERLVIADQDAGAACDGTLSNLVSRNRTSFDFTTKDGRSLSFSGNGFQQERTEETDPLQPINLVVTGSRTGEGVAQTTALAIGACRFTTPEPGRTGILCEAKSPDGKLYAGSFNTAAKPATGATSP
ncbi:MULTISPECIES: hypothetical protein [Methylobacterium]|uniref:Uncharacterized protein n=1 Tax=Methylobacterium jeotgali TaxID=381630 RepID=A0ABQ4SST7_9HYPH|nr:MULTISPECIES: hypothetical protein [Methylobacterium]PIU08148.1 MAG: hypothetical protein COT56_02140 [Methylobacterium sp. CG09_land_8_20_14_0_10_71_15]PIU15658.1 MAG: hypothetical protein COT28_03390 [Methylobacterium sp. CG08_land_8_20_14_0_20_71_15]GBU17288.1 hypothetical protein AwMethylo_15030 [Methylobacterium sp.]GJE06270.1 hypothetical protein AOPFMNJM_1585 [Methylobacterium jeotgali]